MVTTTLRHPLHRRVSGTHGRYGRARKNLAATSIRSLDRPVRRKSLRRLRYPGLQNCDIMLIILKYLLNLKFLFTHILHFRKDSTPRPFPPVWGRAVYRVFGCLILLFTLSFVWKYKLRWGVSTVCTFYIFSRFWYISWCYLSEHDLTTILRHHQKGTKNIKLRLEY